MISILGTYSTIVFAHGVWLRSHMPQGGHIRGSLWQSQELAAGQCCGSEGPRGIPHRTHPGWISTGGPDCHYQIGSIWGPSQVRGENANVHLLHIRTARGFPQEEKVAITWGGFLGASVERYTLPIGHCKGNPVVSI
jgi:hypothetical protein